MCFISDRVKGLKSALSSVFNESVATVCLRHLVAKIKNNSAILNFYSAALTFNSTKFKNYYFYLCQIPEMYEVISDITNEWARSKIRLPRYNQTTSNISESMNSVLMRFRN